MSGIRFGTQDDRTRIVVDVDDKVEFETIVETSPPRLVIELPRLHWRLRPSPQSEPRGLATARRFGSADAEKDRLIVDVERDFSIRTSMLLLPQGDVPHYRLVVDIVPTAASAATARADPAPQQPAAALPGPQGSPAKPQVATGTAFPVPVPRPDRLARSFIASKPVIVLDPGHGGIDPGAVGVNDIYEKDIVLRMTEELARLLRATGRYDVVLTRRNDVFLPLGQRLAVSRDVNADLFISVHADSIGKKDVRGASVYTLSEKASDGEAAKLASKENKADILGGVDLSTRDETVARILIDLAQRDTNNKSIEFANLLINQLVISTNVLRRTRRYAGFVVLKSPDTPSVLLELGYLSNAKDAQDLVRPEHRAKIGSAIVRAIDGYFDRVKHAMLTQ